jgi:hypothetical protein
MGQKFKPQFMRLLAIDNALRKGGAGVLCSFAREWDGGFSCLRRLP